jgi:HTH-type transcriptional regulator / antitoxin HigA
MSTIKLMQRKYKMLNKIENDSDHIKALARIDEIIDAPEGTPECQERHLLFDLVEAYEDEHYHISMPDPIDAIKFRMEQANLTENDLVPFIGSIDKVNGVLNKQILLNPSMIKALHTGLKIPMEMLIQEADSPAPDNAFNIRQENHYNTYEAPAFA